MLSILNNSTGSSIGIIFYITNDQHFPIRYHYDLVVVVIAHYLLQSIQMYNFQFLTWCSSIFALSTPPTMTNTDEHNTKTQLICKNVAPVCLRLFLLVLVCGFRVGSVFSCFSVLFLVVPCFFLFVSGCCWFPLVFPVVSCVFLFFRFPVFFWIVLFFQFSLFFQCFHGFPGLSWCSLLFLFFPGFPCVSNFVPSFSWFSWCSLFFQFLFLVFLLCSVFFVFSSFVMIFLAFPDCSWFSCFAGFPNFPFVS